mmetsp:Transcript_26989/g.27231  ORF Transcript_26989/g.27231 Transcript_26989/m.27231 type:complete len:153 (+) Transcript_26989:81-539(+)
MGICSSCCKNNENENGEYSRISTSNVLDNVPVENQRRTPNYQAVVDEAHRNFLSSSFTHRNISDSEVESMRTKLLNSTISTAIFTSPKKARMSPYIDANSPQGVIEILSEPVKVFDFDVLADEMAEMVAKHTFNLRADDSNTTVASFKPVFP